MISPIGGSAKYPQPPARKFRVYAFDPQSAVELDTAVINDALIEIPWETPWEDPLGLGPTNEYLEVVDYDPASGVFYPPLDPNDPWLLAQNGLPPAEGRPQFHQQMVFAVAMRTVRTFERALGRPVLWADDQKAVRPEPGGSDPYVDNFTRRLRIYPHGLREPNAYYSPDKRALLFGYFKRPAPGHDGDTSWIFTCLSQDIVAHETTHAILHGLQRRSVEASNVDTLAFHEAFADIVALLQRFSATRVVAHQLAASGGSLRTEGLLTGLAKQFGEGTGRDGALRYALKAMSKEARDGWRGADAAARKLDDIVEPHERGGVLVAAVFDAFVTIYERRVADLLRLASLAADHQLSSELVDRLAREAGKAADHVLRMCVRALDYVPPVDMRFGEYLRAIVTADADLVPDDPLRYRVAFVEAFKKRGIFVPGCISMAPDSLLWEEPDESELVPHDSTWLSNRLAGMLSTLQLGIEFIGSDKKRAQAPGFQVNGGNRNLRDLAMKIARHNQWKIHAWLKAQADDAAIWERLLGLHLPRDGAAGGGGVGDAVPPASITRNAAGEPSIEVHSARIARRQGPSGESLNQLVVQITQRRRAYYREEDQQLADGGGEQALGAKRWARPDFWFRGGATLLVDLRDGRLRRIIRRRISGDSAEQRLRAQRAFLTGDRVARDVARDGTGKHEPFALVHRDF